MVKIWVGMLHSQPRAQPIKPHASSCPTLHAQPTTPRDTLTRRLSREELRTSTCMVTIGPLQVQHQSLKTEVQPTSNSWLSHFCNHVSTKVKDYSESHRPWISRKALMTTHVLTCDWPLLRRDGLPKPSCSVQWASPPQDIPDRIGNMPINRGLSWKKR